MILIPRLLNKFSKDRPSWQERYDRRLALLKFAGMGFWLPEDFALAGPMPPEVMASVSAFPYGSAAVAGAGGDVLTLNAISHSHTDSFLASASLSFQRDGEVLEGLTAQNPGTEWIDNNAATVGDDYECKADHTSGTTTPTFRKAGASDVEVEFIAHARSQSTSEF